MKKIISSVLLVTILVTKLWAFAGKEIHYCVGSPEKCVADITVDGIKIHLESLKDKGSATVIIKEM